MKENKRKRNDNDIPIKRGNEVGNKKIIKKENEEERRIEKK